MLNEYHKGNRILLGDWVKFDTIITMESNENKRIKVVNKLKGFLCGRIAGKKQFYAGDIETDYYDPEFDGGIKGGISKYLNVKKSIQVYEVKFTMMNKPLYVREEDLEFVSVQERLLKQSPFTISNLDKKGHLKDKCSFKLNMLCDVNKELKLSEYIIARGEL